MRTILICTVGTSLINNLRRLDPQDPIHQALDRQDWQDIATRLLEKPNSDRLCGAEINSITSIVKEALLSQFDRLIFLVSDTDDGRNTGAILQAYYAHASNPVQFDQVPKPTVLEKLNHHALEDFQRIGLKNLVREISSVARDYSEDAIAINATGGYKAQISFAGMIGQALNIPVYYLFEGFERVIQLPPQPVSLNLTLWLENYDLFTTLDEASELPKAELDWKLLEVLEALVEEVEVEGVTYIALSAMGELFHRRCQFQFHRQEQAVLAQLPQADQDPATKNIHIAGDHHGNDKLKALAQRLVRSPYVESIPHSREHHPRQRNCVEKVYGDGRIDFVLTQEDKGYGLCIQTTGRNEMETACIAEHLARKYYS